MSPSTVRQLGATADPIRVAEALLLRAGLTQYDPEAIRQVVAAKEPADA